LLRCSAFRIDVRILIIRFVSHTDYDHMSQILRSLRLPVSVLSFCAASYAATALADPPRSLATQPVRQAFQRLPPGVPAGYLLTRGGFLHPSCVITVHADETVGADQVIRGVDGREHSRISPCAFPAYTRTGVMKAMPTQLAQPLPPLTISPQPAHLPHAAGPVWDGWPISYSYNGKVDGGASVTVSGDVVVPLPPKTYTKQDIAFFNSIDTDMGSDENILQPVLDFGGEDGAKWIVESENCCVNNNDIQSDQIVVSPGDTIHSVNAGTGCDSKGVCSAWVITGTDMATGESATLNTTSPWPLNEVDAAVFETYDITSCDMLPANGEATYFNHSVVGDGGKALALKYDLDLGKTPAGFPMDCGYKGSVSGNNYTLIFSTSPTSAGGGPNAAGGTGGTSNGAGGTGGGTNNADGPGVGGTGAGGVSVGGAGGIASSVGGSLDAGGDGGGLTASGVSGSLAFGGASSQAGSANPGGGAAAANTATGGQADTSMAPDSSPSASCSCRMGAHSSPVGESSGIVFLLGLAQLLRTRRRKQS
jgi:MYXO-CTERM domain-containing protein